MSKITIERATVEQALEFIENHSKHWNGTGIHPQTTVIDLRAALAEQPAQQESGEDRLGGEWVPCVKLPVTVHVRHQRPGETHVSTREGITPVKPDDLIMRGVAGEEYPIGRELWEKTYTTDLTQPVIDRSAAELRSRLKSALSSGESNENSLKSRDEDLLRQALKQPNEFTPYWDQLKPFNDKIAELERLAKQPAQQQEPVALLTEDEKTELLDWVSACQSAYAMEQNPRGPFRPLPGQLKDNRQGVVDCINEILRSRIPAPPVIDKSAAIRIATALGWEPKREWVGLTDEEICESLEIDGSDDWTFKVAHAVEAMLKAKNEY